MQSQILFSTPSPHVNNRSLVTRNHVPSVSEVICLFAGNVWRLFVGNFSAPGDRIGSRSDCVWSWCANSLSRLRISRSYQSLLSLANFFFARPKPNYQNTWVHGLLDRLYLIQYDRIKIVIEVNFSSERRLKFCDCREDNSAADQTIPAEAATPFVARAARLDGDPVVVRFYF
jgi:hypothetical protein